MLSPLFRYQPTLLPLLLYANYFNYAIKYYNLILFFLETIETTLGD